MEQTPIGASCEFLPFSSSSVQHPRVMKHEEGGQCIGTFFFWLKYIYIYIYICTCKKSGAKYTNWSDRNETVIKLLRKRSPKIFQRKKKRLKGGWRRSIAASGSGGIPKAWMHPGREQMSKILGLDQQKLSQAICQRLSWRSFFGGRSSWSTHLNPSGNTFFQGQMQHVWLPSRAVTQKSNLWFSNLPGPNPSSILKKD